MQGRTSFDNFGWAFLNILQVMTLDGWNDQMYHMIDALGNGVVAYYILIIFLGTYFGLSLLTAVLSAKFAQLQEETQVYPVFWKALFVSPVTYHL